MRVLASRLIAFVRGALRALPVETVAVLSAMVALILAIEDVGRKEMWLMRVTLAAPIVAALGFAFTLLARAGRIGRRTQVVAGFAIGAAVEVAMWLGLPDDNPSDAFVWRYAASFLAALLVPFVAMAIGARRAERFDVFARFVRRFFEQTTLWALLGGAALAAVAVVFVSIGGLFDVRVEELGAQCGLVVLAGVALAWLYRLLPDAAPSQVPELWRRLVTAVGAPFVAVMLVILATYQAWALLRGELPRNMMSPLVIAAGAVGFLCTLIVVAILREAGPMESVRLAPADRHPWARTLSIQIARAFPLALLALLPLAGWSLAVRLDEHGMTPARVMRLYALVALGVLAVWGTVRYVRRRPPLAWEIPSVLAVVAVIAGHGPLSMVSLSVRSQTARLDAMLTEAGIRDRVVRNRVAGADPSSTLSSERFGALARQIEVVERLDDDALREVLGGDVTHCYIGDNCLAGLGVVESDPVAVEQFPSEAAEVAVGEPFVLGDRLFQRIVVTPGYPFVRGELAFSLDGTRLALRRADRVVASVALDAIAQQVLATRMLAAEPLVLGDDPRSGQLLVDELRVVRDPSGTRIESLRATWIRPL